MSVSPDAQSFCQNKNRVAPAVDSLREEFRKYLESGGLLDVLTGVVKDLYKKVTKPTDPLNFVVYDLGAVNFDTRECAALKEELRELKAVVKNLEEENRLLRSKIEESADLE